MSLDQIANIAEIGAAVLVIVSLIYIGIQIKQNTRATTLATAQNISHDLRELNAIVANDTEMAEIHLKGAANEADLTPVERHRFYFYMNNAHRVYENAYYQKQAGALGAYVWEGVIANILIAKDTSGYQSFWRDRKQIFSKEYQAFYDNELPKSDVDPLSAYRSAEEHE